MGREPERNMNERNKVMYWCLIITICGIHFCSGSTTNSIRDYQAKDYLLSTASTSNINKFEDNEIRGKRTRIHVTTSWLLCSGSFYGIFGDQPEAPEVKSRSVSEVHLEFKLFVFIMNKINKKNAEKIYTLRPEVYIIYGNAMKCLRRGETPTRKSSLCWAAGRVAKRLV